MTSDCVLLDTNIVSYLFRKDPRVASITPLLSGKTVVIASQTLAELHYGALKREWGASRYAQLLTTIKNYLIIDTDPDTAETWAELSLSAEATGRAMSAEDLWILATAVRWRLPLLTSDKGFAWHEEFVELIDL